MDSNSSKARVPQGLGPPTGLLPPDITAPTGLRSSIQAQKPPGPIKLGNRQIPSVLSPLSLTKITYEEAIEQILEQMGQCITKHNGMPSVQTSVVLHDPRGGVLKASDGLLLQCDVSLCYLITWLQIFTDNYVAKYHPGNDLVVRSVEIRFHNKQTYMSYPNLEGGLSYFNANGIAAASVSWPCDNSLMEQYWEAYRSMMQLGSDDQIKYPIIKIRTVKYLAGDPNGTDVRKSLGGGHVFVVDEEDLDVHRYFDHHGLSFPESLIHLDEWLTESENQQLSQNTREQQQTQTESSDTRQKEGPRRIEDDNWFDFREPQHDKTGDTNLNAYHANKGEFTPNAVTTSTMNSNSAGGNGDLNEPNISSPIRQLPLKKVPVHIGDYSTDVSVPFRPPVHHDPNKNWRKFQRSGGMPQLHDAFPLDHVVYDPKDMPEVDTLYPRLGKSSNKESQYGLKSGIDDKKVTEDSKEKIKANDRTDNTGQNRFTTCDTRDMGEAYEAAIGFSSDDDETFFPARNMKEDVRFADINRLPKPIHRHGHRPSQNENLVKDKEIKKRPGWEMHGSAADSMVSDSKASRKVELAGKKFTSTMNVNAPEFVNTSASVRQASDFEYTMNPLASGFPNHALPGIGFAPIMKFNQQPSAIPNLPLLMAAPGHYIPYPSPYPGAYLPRFSEDPNFWALPPIYSAKSAPLSDFIRSPSKPPSVNSISQKYSRNRESKTEGDDTMLATIDELTRKVAQQTLKKSNRREAKSEDTSCKTDDKITASYELKNFESSEASKSKL